jgi:hypothetical protein
MQAGAAGVHGFDTDAARVTTARYICAGTPGAVFRPGSVTPWPAFAARNADLLLPRYDIVLYLAVHQHLNPDLRDAVLDGLLALAQTIFAIRTPDKLFDEAGLGARIRAAGFEPVAQGASSLGGAGLIRIYRRQTQP